MNRLALIYGTCVLLLCGCSMDEDAVRRTEETVTVGGREVPSSSFEQGMVRIRLSRPVAGLSGGGVKSLGTVRMERTFPDAGRFEARTRKEGLHLWYDVYFDPEVGLSEAYAALASAEYVEAVEYRPVMCRAWAEEEAVSLPEAYSVSQIRQEVFDDPLLYTAQWHYLNDGHSVTPSLPGADINVLPVWKRGITGDRSVVVAVIDSGIDYGHDDLAANMWHDADGSCGWNFVRGSSDIIPELHGTHVAGTIAAVNNNGVGVSGIAGGDHAAGVPGVRIMNCQVFEGNSSVGGAVAMKWAADHGAVISQNSWGYEAGSVQELPQSDKEAIDYFIKYAGLDENGVQTGPMAGGVVIFAAGNDGVNMLSYPASYEECIAVAGISADYESGYYSNYGPWVDISAPGGDQRKGTLVWSTIPDNQYGGLQGTSMACPHVTGVAALMVSLHGGPGYTAEQLRSDLLAAADDVTGLYNPYISLGSGLVNAAKAVFPGDGAVPGVVTDLSVTCRANMATVSLTVPGSGGSPVSYVRVYYSGSPELDKSSCDGAYLLSLDGAPSGSRFSGAFPLPDFGEEYFIAVAACDELRYESALSEAVAVTTGDSNSEPSLTALDGLEAHVTPGEELRLRFLASDPDGHILSASVSPVTEGVSTEWNGGDTLSLLIDGCVITAGEHVFRLSVDDGYGGRASDEVALSVYENIPPEVTDSGRVLIFESMQPESIDLDRVFHDPDGGELEYTFTVADSSVASLSLSDGILTVTPVGYGVTEALITAADAAGSTVSLTVGIGVCDGSRNVDLYPVPVMNVLNVRVYDRGEGEVTVRSSSGSVVYSRNGELSLLEPVEIDMSDEPGGIYTVTVSCGGWRTVKSVAKL